MFKSARFKLAAWYLLIIMLISISFSVAIFYILSRQMESQYRRTALRLEQRRELLGETPLPPMFEPEEVYSAQEQLKANLVYINFVILGVSSVAGYFLAGRTLKPIQKMVLEQDRFIADASHELRTPLTALRSEIEVNLRDRKLNLSDAKKLLSSNLEEVIHLQSLSDALLALAQYEKETKQISFERISIKEVVEEACKKVSPLAKKQKIWISDTVGNYFIKGDRQSLIQLFLIFLDNALKYSSKNSKVEVFLKTLDHSVEINVKDNGMGISEKDLPYIFDRFYRVEESRNKKDLNGYGLGLSIAKKIVEFHKGKIEVESKTGKGTTFKIVFPKA